MLHSLDARRVIAAIRSTGPVNSAFGDHLHRQNESKGAEIEKPQIVRRARNSKIQELKADHLPICQ